jgi:hypothetical protein
LNTTRPSSGHGMLIGELEARMRRVEQHLNLPTIEVG